MSCKNNNSVMILYDIDEKGVTLPSKYEDDNLVGDMLKALSIDNNDSVIEIPIEISIADEPTDEIPLVTVQTEQTLPTTSSILPTTPSVLSTPAPTTPAPTTPAPTTPAPTTTPESATTPAPSSGPVEYFTNKLTCSKKKNYLLFGVVLTIILLVIVLILTNKKNKLV